MTADQQAAFARAVALMDQHYPLWEERVDPDALDLTDLCFCVVGQAAPAGTWWNAAMIAFAVIDGDTLAFLNHDVAEAFADNELYREAWRAEIRARRARGGQ